MSDMYGAVCSNWFKPKDLAAMRTFLEEEVRFGDEIEIWDNKNGTMAFGGYEQYPNAYPYRVDPDFLDDDWDLDEFATRIRDLLAEGEEFRVFAAGHEKLRYVAATHLIVTPDIVDFRSYGEG